MPGTRILFSAAGGHGHLQPLIPLACAAVAAGHEVLVSATPSLAERVEKLGLPFAPSGPELLPIRSELTLHTLDEERQAIPRHFIGNLGPARAADLSDIARDWGAEQVVGDEADYGSVVVAEQLDLPHATVITNGAGGLAIPEQIRGPLENLRRDFDLPAEDGTLMLRRSLKLNSFPAEFRSPTDPLTGRVINYRSAPVFPDAGRSDGGTVYVTLGTIFNTESGDLLARLSSASAAAAGVRSVIVATGEHLDPAGLGAQPEEVTAYQFVAQHEVLSTCSAVVCHGGSGTVLDAISHGLPLVLLPLGADQPLNAQRCSALGCAVVLSADAVGMEQITRAVDEVLTQPSYREASARLRAGLAQLPSPDDVIRTLGRLWAA